mgnify:CR=1 FL=1
MKNNVKNIDEMISFLEKVKESHGNLPIMSEYDANYCIGSTLEVIHQNNPDNYLGDKIEVLFIN